MKEPDLIVDLERHNAEDAEVSCRGLHQENGVFL